MASTKIINVLRTEEFEDILDIFKEASADEVIFVLPKRGKSFNNEGDFQILSAAASESGKKVSLLCANPDINARAANFGFQILSTSAPKPQPAKVSAAAYQSADDSQEEEEEYENDDSNNDRDSEPEIVEAEEDPEVPAHDEADEDISGEEPEEEEGGAAFSESSIETGDDEDSDYEVLTAAKMDKTLQDVFKPEVKKSTRGVKLSPKAESAQKPGVRKPSSLDEVEIIPQRAKPMVSETKKEKSQPAMKESEISNLTDKTLDEIKNVWQSQKSQDNSPVSLNGKVKPPVRKFSPERTLRMPRFFSGMPKRMLWSFTGIAVILFGTIIFISTGKAKIIIKPREQKVDFRMAVSISDNFSTVDPASNSIPGQIFSVSKTVTETFDATGEKDVAQKARGKITVYNEYSSSPQTLIATTRFEYQSEAVQEKGLVFRTLKTITVPGYKVINGKTTPGAVEVEVIADKAGQIYNVGSGKFSIVAFRERGDTERYQKFYGGSTAAMKGGIVGKSKVVTDSDYGDAKKTIETSLNVQMEEAIKAQMGGLKILGADKPEIKSFESTADIDAAADNFTMTIVGAVETIGFKMEDLHSLIAAYLSETNNLQVLSEKLSIEFEDMVFDAEAKTLKFEAVIGGGAYKKGGNSENFSGLNGKNESEIKDYIKTLENISSARVVLSPFWVKRIPKNEQRIEVEINY